MKRKTKINKRRKNRINTRKRKQYKGGQNFNGVCDIPNIETLDTSKDNSKIAIVLNLDHRKDRCENIKKAFDGMDLTLYRLSAIKNDAGLKGAGLSHIKAVEYAKKYNLPSILVLEDDCSPNENFKNDWTTIKNWLDTHKDKWDLFSGGTTYYGFHTGQGDIDTIKPICKLNENIKLFYVRIQGMQFVYYNSSVYDAILELNETNYSENVPYNAFDLWPNDKQMKIITSTPFLSTQATNYSDIGNEVLDQNKWYLISEENIKKIENNIVCN